MEVFKKIWAWIKEHPWTSAFIALGGFLLAGLLAGVFGGGSSSASSSTSSGPSDALQAAAINASAQVQAAQIAAGAQQAGVTAQAQTEQQYIASQQTVDLATIQAQTTAAVAGDQLQLDLTNSNNSAAVQALQLQLGAQLGDEAYQLANTNLTKAKPIVGAYGNLINNLTTDASTILASHPSTPNATITGTLSSTIGQQSTHA